MKSRKKQNRKKRLLIIVVIIIVAAMMFSYVFQLTTFATSTPPPDNPDFGTDWDHDESTLPAPWEEEDDDEEEVLTDLYILSGPVKLNVGERTQIQWKMENFPDGTLVEWRTSNPDVAVVSDDGIVVAVAPGNTEVIVMAGEKRASVLVTVNDLRAESISIKLVDKNQVAAHTGTREYELNVGDVIMFQSELLPKGSIVDSISWDLGNDKVASLTKKVVNNEIFYEMVALDVGSTTLSVSAEDKKNNISIRSETLTFKINESGVPINQLWDYIRYGVILVVVIVGVAVFLTWLGQRHKKEKERLKAIARKRRKEAIRRAREEEEAATTVDKRDTLQVQAEPRETVKVNGTAVGAGISAPPAPGETESERPLTLDDLD